MRSCEQGGAFIDLVEGIRAEHQGITARWIDDALGKSKERFTRANYGKDLIPGVGRWYAVATAQPAGNGFAQGVAAGGRGIIRQAFEIAGECFLDEGRRLVLRFANGQPDLAQPRGGLDALEQLAQFLERVRVQLVEVGVHVLFAA